MFVPVPGTYHLFMKFLALDHYALRNILGRPNGKFVPMLIR